MEGLLSTRPTPSIFFIFLFYVFLFWSVVHNLEVGRGGYVAVALVIGDTQHMKQDT